MIKPFSFIKKRFSFLSLGAIFLLSLFLRTYHLATLPFYFHQDEVMNGYVGRFILQNGKDLYGNSFPLLYFDRFGDFPNVIPMYLSGLSTFIFGINEFAVRFPIALAGSLTVLLFYFLGKLFFKDSRFALFFSFLLAICPWHIALSRATAEGVTALAVFVLGFYLALKGLKEDKKKLFFLSLPLFLLTYFLYPGYRVFTPLSLLPFLFLNFKTGKVYFKKKLLFFVVPFFLLSFLISTTSWGKGRFEQTSLFYNQEVKGKIGAVNIAFIFDEGSDQIFEARVFHNKIVGYYKEGVEQYLNYFSPGFLFVKGGLPDRYLVPNQGLFYLTSFALLFFLLLPARKRNLIFYYFLYLLLISPIPAALTVDDVPNIHRSAALILPVLFLATVGFKGLISLTKNKHFKILISFLIVLLIGLEFIYFWHQYSNHTASYKGIYRNGGSEELVSFIKDNEAGFDQVIMPGLGTLPLYYLFYNSNFNSSLVGRFEEGMVIPEADKAIFINNWCPSRETDLNQFEGKIILVNRPDCDIPLGFEEIEIIERKDSTAAFRILGNELFNLE